MSTSATVTIQLDAQLTEFVERQVSAGTDFEDAGAYLKSLVARDMARVDHEAFERLKTELKRADEAPEEAYVSMTAADVISRNSH